MKKYLVAALAAFAALSTALSQNTPDTTNKYALEIKADRADARYAIGEIFNFEAELEIEGRAAGNVSLPYTLRLDDLAVIDKGELAFTAGKATLQAKFEKPSFLILQVNLPRGSADKTAVYAGAACEPWKLAPSMPKPDDFDSFWDGVKKQLDEMPADLRLDPVPEATDDKVETWAITMNALGGAKLYGFYSKPRGAGPYPVFMEVRAAGVFAVRPLVSYARRGVLAVTVNPHPIPNDQPPEYYTELRAGELKGYPLFGRDSRDTNYFLRMFGSCYQVARFATRQPEWDGERFVVYGSSQGGGQAFVTASLCPEVTAFAANVPALCDHTGREAGRAAGWPRMVAYENNEANAGQLSVSRYFDAMNFAYNIRARALVSSGFIDRTCPPGSVYAAFNVLPGEKRMVDMPLTGHGASAEFRNETRVFIERELGLSE